MVGQLEAPVYANALLYSWQRAAPRREAQSLQSAQTSVWTSTCIACNGDWPLSKISKGPG